MVRRQHLVLTLILALLFTLSFSSLHAQEETVLRILSNADIRTSDPHIAYETETWPTSALFNMGLVRWSDDNSEVIPALAESYSVSDDGLVYTFTLREGLKFSNGRDITTADVKWSFERLLNPATASPTAYMFAAITGTTDFQNGAATEVSGIQIVDDRTITFTLDYPVWSLIQRFALPPGFIIPSEAVEAAGTEFGRQPSGAGPYILERWEPGVIITGVRNPNYYLEGKPVFDRFEMQLMVEPSVGILRMEAGEADIALDFVPNSEYPRISTDPVISAQLLPTAGFPNIDYIVLNTTIAPYNIPEVRQAMALSVDRTRLVQILNGRAEPAVGPIPPSVLGNNADLVPLTFDPDAAEALLTAAGYPDGFSGTLLTNTDPTNLSVVQALINDWAAIGINLQITSIDNAQFLDILVNQPDTLEVVMTNWYLDYPDPSNIWEPLLACGGSYNWGQFCDEALEAQFAEANAIPPGDARWAAFSAFEEAIVGAMPNIFLEHQLNFYFTSARLSIQSDPGVLLRWDGASIK
ncbi:MAG: ABC transporter substrate-binding protein [Chloroflexi bacterium]|uniref:ABC transporter substrate-binding protein n=1 Tax=Candidatus Flexifilum breve TaxID=3140694 RepID=UPI0031359A0D|nr:ABC transporter substrate-binding protein [Chloroflexota bacterium]